MTIRGAGGRDQTPHIIIVEHHPADSRTKIADDQKNVQSLTQWMGTGGQCSPNNGRKERNEMPKYIDAEKVHGNCHFCKKEEETCFGRKGSHRYCWEFDENLAADVQKIKHGEWIITETRYGEIVTCPYCGARPRKSDYGYYLRDNFCPNCGARMGEKKGEMVNDER